MFVTMSVIFPFASQEGNCKTFLESKTKQNKKLLSHENSHK